MPTYIHEIIIGKPIGNLYRKRHVLILVTNSTGNILLGVKDGFYPSGIARMIGGGVNEREEPVFAAQREIKEEIGIRVSQNDIKALCTVITRAQTDEGLLEMNTWIYTVRIDSFEGITPSDDINGVEIYTIDTFLELIEKMKKLSPMPFITPNYSFLWSDWGAIYACIHTHAINEYVRTLKD